MSAQVTTLPPDSVRAILDRVFDSPEYVWGDAPPDFLTWLGDKLASLSQSLDTLLAEHPVLYWTLLVILLVILGALLTHFALLLYRAFQGPGRQDGAPNAPPVISRDARWHLQHSRELRDAGRYAEAIAHRFMALLLDLDRVHVIRFHPAKTPAEYVSEVSGPETDRARFGTMVDELYRCRFGGSTCTAETWSAFDGLAQDVGRAYASH